MSWNWHHVSDGLLNQVGALQTSSKADDQTPSFIFVVRNPLYLDIPLKMSGSPNIYKLPKELFYGARDKL